MALQKKSAGTSSAVDVDFPETPILFAREPDRQAKFEEWLENFKRSLLLKFDQVGSTLDKKQDKE